MKRYCRGCGEEMTKTSRVVGHDVYSGLPVYELTWKCPKYIPFWSWFENHDKFYTNENGDFIPRMFE